MISPMVVHISIFTDVHVSDFLVPAFCIVVLGEPVCYVQVWARIVYNAYPIFVTVQHDVL